MFSEYWVCFTIDNTVPTPVLLQRSLMHSGSARFSQTIIHSALCKDLMKKLTGPSCVAIKWLIATYAHMLISQRG